MNNEIIKKCCVCGKELNTNFERKNGYYLCEDCDNKYGYHFEINRYGLKPITRFNNCDEMANSTNCYIGCELEISKNRGYALDKDFIDFCYNTNKLFYTKQDGSVDYGYELVSHPLTLQKWYENFDLLKEQFLKMKNLGYVSDEAKRCSCGLHFHVSKKYLGNNDLERKEVINYIWLILENFKSELFNFSRRNKQNIEHWSHFLSDTTQKNMIEEYKSLTFVKGMNLNASRYQALNTINLTTIEFRFFKGTLNINTFYASLELVQNIVDLAKRIYFDKKGILKNMSFNSLVNVNKTKYLKPYLKLRNIDTKIKLVDYSTQLERLKRIKLNRDLHKILKIDDSFQKRYEELKESVKINCIKRALNLYGCALIDLTDVIYCSNERLSYELKEIIGKVDKISINDYKKMYREKIENTLKNNSYDVNYYHNNFNDSLIKFKALKKYLKSREITNFLKNKGE